MFTLAGKTATSSAISHQPAQRAERSCSMASAPAISATPDDVDDLAVARQRVRHRRLVRAGLDEVQHARAEEEQREREAAAHQAPNSLMNACWRSQSSVIGAGLRLGVGDRAARARERRRIDLEALVGLSVALSSSQPGQRRCS